jgi:hypothetical protein
VLQTFELLERVLVVDQILGVSYTSLLDVVGIVDVVVALLVV